MSTKEPHGRVPQSSLAGWIREAITAAYQDLSVAERRDILGLPKGSHPTNMDAAAWKSPVTLAGHHLKDPPNLKGRFGQALVTAAGASGGAKTTTA